MANQYKNKVVYYGETLMDISDTTATAADVASGKKIYGANGAPILGTGAFSVTEVFYINVTGSGTQASPYTADHTYAEITTALAEGKLPIVIYNDAWYIFGGDSSTYDFYQVGDTFIRTFSVSSADVWTDQTGSLVTSVNGLTGDIETNDVLPDQTGEDGKFLMTDGSDAIWASIPEIDFITNAEIDAIVAS